MTGKAKVQPKKQPKQVTTKSNPAQLKDEGVNDGRSIILVTLVYLMVGGGISYYMISQHNEFSTYKINYVLICAFASFLALFITIKLIPRVAPKCVDAELFGRDINKNGTSKVPESMGIVSGIVCLITIISVQFIFPGKLGEHNAALIAMCLMLLLGFCDDVLDIRWRDKILLSFVASVPLLVGYSGETWITIPSILASSFGGINLINLGFFYHAYMANTVVFCTNSINIYAGINGLETGQSLIMAIFVLIHNCFQLGTPEEGQHVLSIIIMLPFFATTLGLYHYNRYPSRVFVGDSFTYFAGMSFAVAGILGHFSKTLMIIFIPQIINFVLSLPQLFHIIPCPRHRLPKLNSATGKLEPTPNLTLINIWLRIFGSSSEKSLCNQLLFFQVICCAFGLYARYYATIYYY